VSSFLDSLRTTHEGLSRAVVKTVVYRVIMVLITVVVAFVFTDDAVTSVSIGLTANVVKTFTYFGYERLWARIDWGYGG
jgi:uncharacterized membrane protein